MLTQADKEAWYCSTIKVICLSEQVTTGSVRLRVSPADEKLPSGVKVRGHCQSRIYAFLSLSVMEIHLPLCWALCSYGSRYWRAFVHIKDTSAQQVSCFRSDNILLANVLLLRAMCLCNMWRINFQWKGSGTLLSFILTFYKLLWHFNIVEASLIMNVLSCFDRHVAWQHSTVRSMDSFSSSLASVSIVVLHVLYIFILRNYYE